MGAANRLVTYFPPGPVSLDFLKSDAFICGIMGPIGSGKSVASVMKIQRNAMKQPIASDGFRKSRYAIVRNTMPMLKTTTMATWHQWVPKSIGHWVGQGPPTHHIIDPVNKIDMEVLFVALDSPDDVAKVLSLELTGAWINEAREIPKAIVDGLTGRIGRFNPDVGNPATFAVNPQLIMDTNPPEDDHWWAVLAEGDVSNSLNRQIIRSMEEAEIELRNDGLLMPGQKLFEFYRQPGATSNLAENKENLQPGYYTRAKAGKSEQWINVYINGNYGYVQEGRPVYPEYNDGMHCKPIDLIPGLPILVGLDFGFSPAAVFAQCTPEGHWRIYSEVIGEGMNLFEFADAIRYHIAQKYRGYKIGRITGDPSGDNRSPMDRQSRTTYQILSSLKIHAVPSPDKSNDIVRRVSAVQRTLTRLIKGEPGFLIDPACTLLRKAMAGGYAYKRVKVVGDDRYQDKPDKNRYSHPADACQYVILGGGEYERIIDAGNDSVRPMVVEEYSAMEGVI